MRMSIKRRWRVTAGLLVAASAALFALYQIRLFLQDLRSFVLQDEVTLTAERVQEFVAREHRLPKNLNELGPGQSLTDDEAEYYFDPHSSASGVRVWIRLRHDSGQKWIEGHTDGWKLPSSPPPDRPVR